MAPVFDLDFIGSFYRVYLEDTPTVHAPPGPLQATVSLAKVTQSHSPLCSEACVSDQRRITAPMLVWTAWWPVAFN